MTDDKLDEAIRELHAGERIPDALADRLVAEARPRRGWWAQVAVGVLAAATLAFALWPAGPKEGDAEGDPDPASPAVDVEELSLDEAAVVQAEETLGACFEGVNGGPSWSLELEVEEGELVDVTGLIPWRRVDPEGVDCVDEVLETWRWPEESGVVPLVVMPGAEEVEALALEEAFEGRLSVGVEIYELAPADWRDLAPLGLQDLEGLTLLDPPLEEPPGTLLTSPSLELDFGAEGNVMFGGGRPEDSFEAWMFPNRGPDGDTLDLTLQLPGDPPIRIRDSVLLGEGSKQLGLVQAVGEGWFLVLLDL